MEQKQLEELTSKHILMSEEIAELKIRLKAALLLLDKAKCVYNGAIQHDWQKRLEELKEGTTK